MTWWQFLLSTALIAVPTVSVLNVGLDVAQHARSEALGVLASTTTVLAAVGTSVSLALLAVQVAT